MSTIRYEKLILTCSWTDWSWRRALFESSIFIDVCSILSFKFKDYLSDDMKLITDYFCYMSWLDRHISELWKGCVACWTALGGEQHKLDEIFISKGCHFCIFTNNSAAIQTAFKDFTSAKPACCSHVMRLFLHVVSPRSRSRSAHMTVGGCPSVTSLWPPSLTKPLWCEHYNTGHFTSVNWSSENSEHVTINVWHVCIYFKVI